MALRVGLIGCGFMGNMHASVYRLLANAELVGVVDSKPDKAAKMAEETGAESFGSLGALLEGADPDVIDVCLPTYLHKEFTVTAAKAGKHVMCEKPMALSLNDADEMIAACEQAGVYFMIGHCIRFWPEYVKLKEIAESGTLGNLLSLNLTRLGQFPSWASDNWMAEESKSGGGVLDMHIHDTDYALFLLGHPKEHVSYGTVDARGPSYAFTTLGYPHCVAHLEGGWNLPSGTPFRMTYRAIFEKGAVFMDGGPMTIYEDGQMPVVPEFPKMTAEGGGNISDLGGYYLELEYFIDRISMGLPLEICTPQTSRDSLALVLREIELIKSKN